MSFIYAKGKVGERLTGTFVLPLIILGLIKVQHLEHRLNSEQFNTYLKGCDGVLVSFSHW